MNARSSFKDRPAPATCLTAIPPKLTSSHARDASANHLAIPRLQQAAGAEVQSRSLQMQWPASKDLLGSQIDALID